MHKLYSGIYQDIIISNSILTSLITAEYVRALSLQCLMKELSDALVILTHAKGHSHL